MYVKFVFVMIIDCMSVRPTAPLIDSNGSRRAPTEEFRDEPRIYYLTTTSLV